MDQYTPTTELEAVNVMLGCVASSPVNSLEGNTNLNVMQARSTLHEINRAVQSKGWWFNSEEDYPLVRSASGEITVPVNTLDVDLVVGRYPQIEVVQRGTRLYDKKNHTYIFDGDLYVDIVSFLPFEEMPEPHRRYVTVRAARTFVDRMVGDSAHHTYTKDDEANALAVCMSLESDAADYNLADNPGFGRATRRHRNGSGL